jgi:flagella basal body P-ring formation protein FlgA
MTRSQSGRVLLLLSALTLVVGSPARGEDDSYAPFVQSVRVGEGGVLEGAAIVTGVRLVIAARLAGEDHEAELTGVVSDVRASTGPATLEVTLPAPRDLIGPLVVSVAVRQHGALVRRLGVPLLMHRFADLVVLARPLRRGDLVQSDMVRIERSERPPRDEAYLAIADVVGFRARRQLEVGRALTTRDVEPLPLVESGASVRVLFERGTLEVEVRAEALSDGWAGDRIRVRSKELGSMIEGVVIGPGLIRFEL